MFVRIFSLLKIVLLGLFIIVPATIYSQQKDISNLTIEINNTKKRVIELENDIDTNLSKEDQKPPHY